MTGTLTTLILAGATTGGVSVVLFFVRAALLGSYPDKFVSFPEKGSVRKAKRKKRGAALRFFLDFFFSLFVGTYLVLYDATVLGGRGRFYHLCFFFFGFFLVRFLFLSLLFRPTERVFIFLLDLIRAAIRFLSFPFRKIFSLLFSFLFNVYLILKRNNDKMKRKREAKREIDRIRSEMDTAFLPSDVTEAIASWRD